MNQQLGEDEFDIIVATGALKTQPLAEIPDTAHLAAKNPRVEQQIAAVESARASLQAARSDVWPYLSAQYARSFTGPDYFPDNAHWNASANLSYRLFGNGLTSTYYSSVAGKRNLEKAEADLRSVRNDVRAILENAWATLADAVDRAQVQGQYLEASQQKNGEATIRYASGLMSFEDWNIAVSDLVQFENGVIQAARDAVVAEANFEKAQGKLLEDK